MQILNFTEPLIKPALQDRSKCFTIRKAWDWEKIPCMSKGYPIRHWGETKTKWCEQKECRHKVGALETIMWNQRGKNNVCDNCWKHKPSPEFCDDIIKDYENYSCFSKVFGVGEIISTKKIWLYNDNEHIAIKTDEYVLDLEDCELVSKYDGFKSYIQFCDFFIKQYPIINEQWMPFWRIKWKWQPQSL